MTDSPEWKGFVCVTGVQDNQSILDFVEVSTLETLNSADGISPFSLKQQSIDNFKTVKTAFGAVLKEECFARANQLGITLEGKSIREFDNILEVWRKEFSLDVAKNIWLSLFGHWDQLNVWEAAVDKVLNRCQMKLSLDNEGNPKSKVKKWVDETGRTRLKQLRSPFQDMNVPHGCVLASSREGLGPGWHQELLMNYNHFTPEAYAQKLSKYSTKDVIELL